MDILQLQIRKAAYNRGFSLKFADECYTKLTGMQSLCATKNVVSLIWDHIKLAKDPFAELDQIVDDFYSLLQQVFKEYIDGNTT